MNQIPPEHTKYKYFRLHTYFLEGAHQSIFDCRYAFQYGPDPRGVLDLDRPRGCFDDGGCRHCRRRHECRRASFLLRSESPSLPGLLLLTWIGISGIDIGPWISNYIYIKLWYMITLPCRNCNGGLAKPPLKLRHGWVIAFDGKRRMRRPGGRLNIKMSSYQYSNSHVKDKTVSPTVLSLTWESPYLGKTVFILRRGPDLSSI